MGRSAMAAAVGLGLVACGGTSGAGTSGGGSAVSLTAQNYSFQPSSFSARPGQAITVTIKNSDSVEHNFSISELSVSQDVDSGETKTVTFTPTGSSNLQFFCKYHHLTKNMVGVLNLGGSNNVGGGSSGGSTPSSSSTYHY